MGESLAVFAVNFLLIFYLQGVRGYTPLTAALLILPLPILTSVIGPLGGRWADHIGGAIPATVGLGIQIAALVGQLTIGLQTRIAAPEPAKRRRRARSRRRRRLPFHTKGVGWSFHPSTVCSNQSMIC